MKPVIVIGKPYKWRRLGRWLWANRYSSGPVLAVLIGALSLTIVGGGILHDRQVRTATLFASYHYQVGERAKCHLENVSGISDDHWDDTVACWITGPGKDSYKGYYAKFWNPDHNTPETELFSVRDLSREVKQ